MLDSTLNTEVQNFLDTFGGALERGDIDAAAGMFQTDCYWRDLVTFTWNIRTMEGPDAVRDMLAAQLASTKPSQWRV
ncbi:MAG: nuclear transport factor 2 family protein, partial [Pseudomonadota bacterium]